MTNRGADAFDIVFEADISSLGLAGSGWDVSFGAQTFDGTGSVDVAYSTDGSLFVAAGIANVTTLDTPFTIALGSAPTTSDIFVRMTLTGALAGGLNQIKLDNVAILAAEVGPAVPEPGTLALVGTGLFGLLYTGRRRP